MYTNQRRLFMAGIFLASSITIARADSLWPSFDKMFDDMEEMFDRHMQFAHDMFNQTRDAFSGNLPSKSSITTEITEDKDQVSVVVNSIRGKELDAHLSEHNDQLTITTNDSKITLNLHHPARAVTSLAVNVRQEQKEVIEHATDKDAKDDTKEQKDTKKSATHNNHSVSVSSIATTVAGKLNLADNTIEYDETAERLTISIPKPTKPAGKKVTINVVNPTTKETAETKAEEKTVTT